MKGELWAAWREVESTYLPNASYFAYQNLAKHQRTILVNWAMEVAADLELSRQTFEVAMNIFDRFFSATKFVDKDLFQVLMTACLWIGAKKEVWLALNVPALMSFRKLNHQSWVRSLRSRRLQT